VRGVTRRAVLATVLALAVLSAAVAVRLIQVRHDYGVVTVAPGARTSLLAFGGRTYLRGTDADAVPAGAVQLGTAPGGGAVFSAPPIPGASPTVLFVRYPDGGVASYALSGGP